MNRVLLYEHDVPLGEWLQAVLTEAGYETVWVKDTETVVQELNERASDYRVLLIEGVSEGPAEKVAFLGRQKQLKTAFFVSAGVRLQSSVADQFLEHPLTRTGLLEVMTRLYEDSPQTAQEPVTDAPTGDASHPRDPEVAIGARAGTSPSNGERQTQPQDVGLTAQGVDGTEKISAGDDRSEEQRDPQDTVSPRAEMTAGQSWASAVTTASTHAGEPAHEAHQGAPGVSPDQEPQAAGAADTSGRGGADEPVSAAANAEGSKAETASGDLHASAQEFPVHSVPPVKNDVVVTASELPTEQSGAHALSEQTTPSSSAAPIDFSPIEHRAHRTEKEDSEPTADNTQQPSGEDAQDVPVRQSDPASETQSVPHKDGATTDEPSPDVNDQQDFKGFSDEEIANLRLETVSALPERSDRGLVPGLDSGLTQTQQKTDLPFEVSEAQPLKVDAHPDGPPRQSILGENDRQAQGSVEVSDSDAHEKSSSPTIRTSHIEKSASVGLAAEKFESGKNALSAGQMDKARIELDASVALAPDEVKYRIWANWAQYVSVRDTIKQARAIRDEIEKNAAEWDNSDARYFAARIAADMGDLQSAFEQAALGMQSTTDHSDTQSLLAELLDSLGESN